MNKAPSDTEKSSAIRITENAEEYFGDFLASAEELKKYSPGPLLSAEPTRLREDRVENRKNKEGFVTVPRVLK